MVASTSSARGRLDARAHGDSPAAFVRGFDLEKERPRFAGFRYRFNRERDVLALCLASQRVLARWGSLKELFLGHYSAADPHVGSALEGFVAAFLEQDLSAVFPRNRLSYGYRHWFPRPSTGGACKRMHLFLRWMVRRERPDFGLWTEVSPAALLMPVDTHIENMARSVGLTRRRSRNWKMVEEITAGLKRLDAEDPSSTTSPCATSACRAVPESAGGRRVRALRPQARLRALER